MTSADQDVAQQQVAPAAASIGTYASGMPKSARRSKPRLSVPATIYFLFAGVAQFLGALVGSIMLFSDEAAAGLLVLVAALALFIPSVVIASAEAKRLGSSTRSCLRSGYLSGFDILGSIPY